MTRVSIIIPTYNRAMSIGRTIQSALNQTYKDFELIIVDDNSSDNIHEILSTYDDSRIKYIKHHTNRGAPAARNTGIKNSNGEFIALLDDDDEWLPQKLEKQIKLFDSTKKTVGMVYGGYEIVNNTGKVVKTLLPSKKGDLFHVLLKSNVIGSPTNLIKRECFEKIHYCDESLKSCQDWDLWLKIAKNYEIEYVPEILARYNLSDSSISRNSDSVLIGHKQILSKYCFDIRKDRKIHTFHLQNIGIYYAYQQEYTQALKYLKMAFIVNPFNLKAIGRYLCIKILKKDVSEYFIEPISKL